MKRRALISVSDKSGVAQFARQLISAGFELISTGGTARLLRQEGLEVLEVDHITGFPEILAGRVKTLHPKIHGGLLARRDKEEDMSQLDMHGIGPIELVCVNLYPFQQTISRPNVGLEEAIENIDIGGPTLLRAAAKNYRHVVAVVDPADYESVGERLASGKEIDEDVRLQLAAKVFNHTAAYDALIGEYLNGSAGNKFPEKMTLTYELKQQLRYGENPQQAAAIYRAPLAGHEALVNAKQLQGKELSYNNLSDACAALQIVREFDQPAAVAVKHSNPCGVGIGRSIAEAFTKAFAADPVSIFGGIVALNDSVEQEVAKQLVEIFLEIIIAPSFSETALQILAAKPNLRLLELPVQDLPPRGLQYTSLPGALLVQEEDLRSEESGKWRTVTERQPSTEELEALKFGWRVVKHVKSNAIVVTNAEMTLGVGAGQMNRVGAAEIALRQAGQKAKGAVLASDAFFPMSDTVEVAAEAGITAIIQPGGSIRDQDSIDRANELGIAMLFTGIRHFKH